MHSTLVATSNICEIALPQGRRVEMQFRVAVNAFVQFCAVERRLSQHTSQAYASDLSDFQRWLGADSLITDVLTDTLKEYLNFMVSERALSPSTVRRRLACLRSFFKFASDYSKLSCNPFEG